MSAKEVSRTLVECGLCVQQEVRQKKGGRELQSPLGVLDLFCRLKGSKMATHDSMPSLGGNILNFDLITCLE